MIRRGACSQSMLSYIPSLTILFLEIKYFHLKKLLKVREKLDGEQSNKNEISQYEIPHMIICNLFSDLFTAQSTSHQCLQQPFPNSRGQWLIPEFHLPELLSIHTCSDVISVKGQRRRQKNRIHSIPRSPGRYIFYNFIIILISLLLHSP